MGACVCAYPVEESHASRVTQVPVTAVNYKRAGEGGLGEREEKAASRVTLLACVRARARVCCARECVRACGVRVCACMRVCVRVRVCARVRVRGLCECWHTEGVLVREIVEVFVQILGEEGEDVRVAHTRIP